MCGYCRWKIIGDECKSGRHFKKRSFQKALILVFHKTLVSSFWLLPSLRPSKDNFERREKMHWTNYFSGIFFLSFLCVQFASSVLPRHFSEKVRENCAVAAAAILWPSTNCRAVFPGCSKLLRLSLISHPRRYRGTQWKIACMFPRAQIVRFPLSKICPIWGTFEVTGETMNFRPLEPQFRAFPHTHTFSHCMHICYCAPDPKYCIFKGKQIRRDCPVQE